jgi:patatin-like phospholipase/acyl hydrolase
MPFQILSLSGGGYLGLYTITVLSEFERRIKRPIASCFDLLAGTSIGGIIALGLAAEKSTDQIKVAFEKNGAAIFSSRPAPKTKAGELADFIRSFRSARYRSEPLRQTIVQILGANTLMGDLRHPVIVPAVNLTKGKPQIFKTDHHPDFKVDHTRNVVDVALATSAAPTYFPIATIGDEMFADGGLFANSPDLVALHEAEYFFKKKPEDIHILSVGTTTSKFSFSYTHGLNLGALAWARRFPQVLLSANQLDVEYMLRHKLGERYLRIDAEQSKEQERALGLDVATADAQKTIRGIATATAQEFVNNPMLMKILSCDAVPPVFYNRAPAQTL